MRLRTAVLKSNYISVRKSAWSGNRQRHLEILHCRHPACHTWRLQRSELDAIDGTLNEFELFYGHICVGIVYYNTQ